MLYYTILYYTILLAKHDPACCNEPQSPCEEIGQNPVSTHKGHFKMKISNGSGIRELKVWELTVIPQGFFLRASSADGYSFSRDALRRIAGSCRRVLLGPEGLWQLYAGIRPAALWQVTHERQDSLQRCCGCWLPCWTTLIVATTRLLDIYIYIYV